jgi:uncharacterized protein (UPF0332 family)
MKKQSFLSKLKKLGRLELVEPSDEMRNSYLEKSRNSLRASRLLSASNLIEESISMAYYSMYHCLLALMFKCGIKCENHAGNILILRDIFKEPGLYRLISNAKEERIDKQYYIDFEASKEDAEKLITSAQDFTTKIKLIIEAITSEDTNNIRKKITAL